MRMKHIGLIGLILLATLILVSCAPGTGKYTAAQPAGLLAGIWHGWIAPIALIVGFFNDNVRIYEPFNSGWWYDFGYYIAIISGFGGISLSRKNKHRHD
jgi:hypothetical protein